MKANFVFLLVAALVNPQFTSASPTNVGLRRSNSLTNCLGKLESFLSHHISLLLSMQKVVIARRPFLYKDLRNLLKLTLVRRPKQARPRPIPRAIPLPMPPRSQLLQLLLLKVVITIIACVKLFNLRSSSYHSAIPTQLLLKHQQLVTLHTFLCAIISRQAFLQHALALTRLRL